MFQTGSGNGLPYTVTSPLRGADYESSERNVLFPGRRLSFHNVHAKIESKAKFKEPEELNALFNGC